MADDAGAPSSGVIAEFTDRWSLLAALRAAREHRDISFDTLDRLGNFPDRYCSKVLSLRGERSITMDALGDLFAALGIRAQLVDDPETLAIALPRMTKRNGQVVRNGAVTITLSRRFFSQIGKKGAAKRNALRIQRKEAARKAALARWHRNGNGK